MEPERGIGPPSTDYKSDALPLSYSGNIAILHCLHSPINIRDYLLAVPVFVLAHLLQEFRPRLAPLEIMLVRNEVSETMRLLRETPRDSTERSSGRSKHAARDTRSDWGHLHERLFARL